MRNTQLSRRGAVFVGSLAIVCGIFPILAGLGVLAPSPTDSAPAPGWVVIAAGLVFILGGLAVLIDYGIGGGIGPDGDFKPGTPLAIRGVNLLLGMGIVGLMAAVSGWIAFGPGPRPFSSTTILPFFWSHTPRSGEMSGRVVFGIGATLLAVMFVACGVVGVRRFIRAWRSRGSSILL